MTFCNTRLKSRIILSSYYKTNIGENRDSNRHGKFPKMEVYRRMIIDNKQKHDIAYLRMFALQLSESHVE